MIFDLLLYAPSSLKLTQYLLTYWLVLANVYLHFYLLNFDIRHIFDVLRSSPSAPTPFFCKNQYSKCSYYVLILCYLYKSYIYARSLFCKQIFKRNINDCNEFFLFQLPTLKMFLICSYYSYFFINFSQFLYSENVFTETVKAVQRFHISTSGC